MFQKIIRTLGGDPHKKDIDRYSKLVEKINQLESSLEGLSDEQLANQTTVFRKRFSDGETLDDLLPEAFASVREASKRTIGLRHYDVQIIGGATLHSGKIAEMRTGEGKTLVATLPLYLNAIANRGVHLVTVNDYLARRDARWMGPIYRSLGLSVGILQMASRTDNGKLAFVYDPEKTSSQEDADQLRIVPRREAYAADITYGTNSEFGFDYLRDNLTMSLDARVQRGHYFAIVDEVDNILIDEARTPLIISGPASEDVSSYEKMAEVVRQMRPEDCEISEKDRTVTLTEAGETHLEEILGMALRDPENPEDLTPEQARILGYVEQAMRAQYLFKRNKDYLVQGGKVLIIDEFTGRLMPGRRWSEGLHQAIEAKEHVKIEPENITHATITLQNYYRMYEKLAGMTGTALTESEEFSKIYKLEVLPIPTNLEYQISGENSPLIQVEDRDELGYRFTFYAHRDDLDKKPVYWRRKDYPDQVYSTEEGKLRAITNEIIRFYVKGRPQLVGTTSVEHSERLSRRLQADMIRRLAQIMIIRQVWMEKNEVDMIDRVVPEFKPLNAPIPDLDTTTIRNVARGYNLSLNPEDPANLDCLIRALSLKEDDKPRLLKVVQGGIPHQVLNARKHDEESKLIERAGMFGAVTIATNMAGRGVDIKLGGELPEEVLRDISRVLKKSESDPYDMSTDEAYQAVRAIPLSEYGIYEESIKEFLDYAEKMRQVRLLGGLHVIGSERHEARRIDNQLRGRAARQGDPGSSRFYLSLQDDLMRIFGGGQVEGIWKRILTDESTPIEMNLLGRIVEQSQERVEGSNFDVRKHLLEYDDVLNSQRKRIYSQRDRVFVKEDLMEDVLDMVRVVINRRVPEALKDEDGAWRLLDYLEKVQPSFEFETISYPSFTYRILLDVIQERLRQRGATVANVKQIYLELADESLQIEKDHLLHFVKHILEVEEERFDKQKNEDRDTLDAFFDELRDNDENTLRPQDILLQISEAIHIPLRLGNADLQELMSGSRQVKAALGEQIDNHLMNASINRILGALQRRLGEEFSLDIEQIRDASWVEAGSYILDTVDDEINLRIERLAGIDGQISKDLDSIFSRLDNKDVQISSIEERVLSRLLDSMAQGTRVLFDRKTHRRREVSYSRLRYTFLAGKYLDGTSDEISSQVLEHLETGLEQLRAIMSRVEWSRVTQTGATLRQMGEKVNAKYSEEVGEERSAALQDVPLTALDENDKQIIADILGYRIQTETLRDLLLRVFSSQWIEYLTQVEALRVSIGMEAYAQRDPLVQYKGKASEMFTKLLAEIAGIITANIFTHRPTRRASLAVETSQTEEVVETQPVVENETQSTDGNTKKKRRRH